MPLKRRHFLRGLGLGASTVALSPIVDALMRDAWGAPTGLPKRVVFGVMTNGLCWRYLLPKGAPEEGVYETKLEGPDDELPMILQDITRWRDRILLLDGPSNYKPFSEHGSGYAALSCVSSSGGSNTTGPPGGITIDQYLAKTLSVECARESVLYGTHSQYKQKGPTFANFFAKGRNRPIRQIISPTKLHASLFGARGDVLAHDAFLTDVLRTDLSRVKRELAGPERLRMEYYEEILSERTRRKAIEADLMGCGDPGFGGVYGSVEDNLEEMTDLATLALACGMTNVVGLGIGGRSTHGSMPSYSRILDDYGFQVWGKEDHDKPPEERTYLGSTSGSGHYAPGYLREMEYIHRFNLSLFGRMADVLDTIPEGDGTMLDNTVMVYMGYNGGESDRSHHQYGNRWPMVVLGDAGGALKADGRFIRVEGGKGNENRRSLAEFYCSLAHAVGVPTNDFAAHGNEPVRGPIEEIMT